MISFDFDHLGSFFCPELSRFPPCSPSVEGGILDSKLENVGPTPNFKFVMRRSICVKYDTAPLKKTGRFSDSKQHIIVHIFK